MPLRLRRRGILRHIDTSVLRAWAIAHDTHIRATAAVTSEELLISPSPDPAYPGPRVPNPAISVLNRQAAILTRCAEQLGFSPTSRPRLSAGPASTPRDGKPVMSIDEYVRSAPPISHLVGRRSQTQEGALTGRRWRGFEWIVTFGRGAFLRHSSGVHPIQRRRMTCADYRSNSAMQAYRRRP